MDVRTKARHMKLTTAELFVYIIATLSVLGGLALICIFIVMGFTVHEVHFRYVGIGSALTAVGAILNNLNFFLLNIRMNKAHEKLHTKIDEKVRR